MPWYTGRKWLVSTVICPLVIAITASLAMAQTTDLPTDPEPEVLCVVNGSPITRDNLNKAIQQQWGRQILEDLIKQQLIFLGSETRGISVSAEELDARLTAIKAEFKSLEEFNRMMHKRGIKGPAFRERLRARILLEKLVEEIGAVTEEQARAYYDKHISDYQSPEQVHLHAIVARDAEQAYQAREQVARGADFDEVASGMDSELGGDWEWLCRDDLRNVLIRETAFSLRPGDVSNPIYVEGEYYVLWVQETKPGVDRSFEETQPEIATNIREDRGITPESVLAGLWRQAEITVPWKAYYYLAGEYKQLGVVKVIVDGNYVAMPSAPVVLGSGRMLVMAKPLLQAMNANITWDADTQTMSALSESGTVQVTVGSLQAKSGDRVVLMSEAPQLRAGSLFIPPRPVVVALGGTVEWDPITYTLKVNSEPQSKSDVAE